MKTLFLVLTLFLYAPGQSQIRDGSSSIPLPSPAQLRWHSNERIMFVHFSANTWQTHRGLDNEWDDHSISLDRIDPTRLNTDQWCQVARSWGAKMIIFVAKHVGGFCFWQTGTTDYGIRNTPWKNGKGDVLEDLSRSCRKYGLDLGIYIYPGDPAWGAGPGSGGITADSSKQAGYTKVFREQMTEVLSRYGEIREVWFDGSCRIEVGDILQRYAPNAVIFQGPMASLRWVGNEDGFAPFSNWYTLSSKDLKTGVATAVQSDPFGDAYAPVEIDVPLLKNGGHKWFWAPNTDHLILNTEQLMDLYYKSVGRGSVLLLNSTPDTIGVIPASHAAAYRAFGKEIQRRFGKPLQQTSGKGNTIVMSFPQPAEINHVVLQEDLVYGQRVLGFRVDGMDVHGEWKELFTGTSVGFKRICYFEPLRVKKVCVTVTNAKAEPRIGHFAVFNISNVHREPEIRNDRDRFYDGVASQQAKAAGSEPEIEIGTWGSDAGEAGWKDLTLDLTSHVKRIGQYEVTFAARPGDGDPGLEFRDWDLQMYGGRAANALEFLKDRAVFRITRSQQTLDEFPTLLRTGMKSSKVGRAGVITIRMLTY